jgi:aspartyl-tRNA(Asn)/glutamyl-tRNA(Gln) amidotransferase subunit C
MVKLSKGEVLHLAKLSKLELSETQLTKFSKQLSQIISYVEELKKVDASDIAPTSQTSGLENSYTEDKTSTQYSLSSKEALSGSDKTYNNLFSVDALLAERTDK